MISCANVRKLAASAQKFAESRQNRLADTELAMSGQLKNCTLTQKLIMLNLDI